MHDGSLAVRDNLAVVHPNVGHSRHRTGYGDGSGIMQRYHVMGYPPSGSARILGFLAWEGARESSSAARACQWRFVPCLAVRPGRVLGLPAGTAPMSPTLALKLARKVTGTRARLAVVE